MLEISNGMGLYTWCLGTTVDCHTLTSTDTSSRGLRSRRPLMSATSPGRLTAHGGQARKQQRESINCCSLIFPKPDSLHVLTPTLSQINDEQKKQTCACTFNTAASVTAGHRSPIHRLLSAFKQVCTNQKVPKPISQSLIQNDPYLHCVLIGFSN